MESKVHDAYIAICDVKIQKFNYTLILEYLAYN